jgi:hypothetical protein
MEATGQEPSPQLAMAQLLNFIIGGPKTPWLGSLWSLLIMGGIFVAWVEAVLETSRCLGELKRHKAQEGSYLSRFPPFSWFDRRPKHRRYITVIFFEMLLRVIAISIMGIFNGVVGMVVLLTVGIPAGIVWLVCRFKHAANRSERCINDYLGDEEEEEEEGDGD